MRQHGKHRLVAEMNVVPYIDVMLVLLVIFMIATPLLTRGVEVELPQASAEPITLADIEQQQPIVLSVDAAGEWYLNIAGDPQQPQGATAVREIVTAALAQTPERTVLVEGDREVAYGLVMAAMVVLQQAGAKSVGLLAESPTDEDAPVGG